MNKGKIIVIYKKKNYLPIQSLSSLKQLCGID